MKITIDTAEKLYDLIHEYQLKPACGLQVLIAHVCSEAQGLEIPTVIFRIASYLIPLSYHTVPAMFARSIGTRVQFPSVQSYMRGGYLIVRIGQEKMPITFRARAIHSLIRKGTFSIDKEAVPVSYKKHPSMFSSIVSSAINRKVCNRRKTNRIIWYVEKKTKH